MNKILFYLPISLVGLVVVAGILLWRRLVTSKQRAEAFWRQTMVSRIENLGTTQTLEIIPLIDWHTRRDDLKGEAGVAYLVKTDATTILFDLGLNAKNEHPSPLLHNMEQLGITPDEIDTIVISHNHLDHVGGMTWSRRKTFSLTNHQMDLGEKVVYTPIPMTYPGLGPIHTPEPTVIAKGVTTIGTIPNSDYFMGWIEEQAIAVNVAGKGIVVITGCGHQTLPKILERVTTLFDDPIYGVIGGYHFPVIDARTKVLGIGIQKYVGTGKPPWSPITSAEVEENIQTLKQHNPQLVALSPHDSCEASITAFRRAFPTAYRDIIVGERLLVTDAAHVTG